MTKYLGRHASLVIPAIVALIGLLLGLGSGVMAKKTYTVSNAVLVRGNPQAQASGQANDIEALIRTQMQNFEYLATSPLVLQPALEKAGLQGTVEDMPGVVSGSATLNTSILEISVTADDPEVAAKLANATQESLIEAVAKYGPQSSNDKPVLVAHQVSKALPPTIASSPKPLMNAMVGVLLGLALGMALAKLYERFAASSPRSLNPNGTTVARRLDGA